MAIDSSLPKLNCDRAELESLLGKLIHVSERGPESMYNQVSLRAEGRGVTLLAQDEFVLLELAASSIKVDRPGIVSIRAQLLHQMVKKLPEPKVTLEARGEGPVIRVTAGGFQSEFLGLPDRVSVLEMKTPQEQTTIPADKLEAAIWEVLFAASPSYSNRVHTEGVKISVDPPRKILKLTATDGRKLGETWAEVSTNGRGTTSAAIVPQSALFKLRQLLRKSERELSFGYSTNVATFSAPGMRFTTRLLEREYPDCEQIFGASWGNATHVDRLGLQQAIGRVLLTYMDPADLQRVDVGFDGEVAHVKAEKQDFGHAEDRAAITRPAEKHRFIFDGNTLTDALHRISTKDVALAFDTADHCLITPVGVDHPRFVLCGVVGPAQGRSKK